MQASIRKNQQQNLTSLHCGVGVAIRLEGMWTAGICQFRNLPLRFVDIEKHPKRKQCDFLKGVNMELDAQGTRMDRTLPTESYFTSFWSRVGISKGGWTSGIWQFRDLPLRFVDIENHPERKQCDWWGVLMELDAPGTTMDCERG
ncbi:hypothetical protein CEXT_645721 [Caerostris extrusa]|uniref:Uncharacterized protein n=1 Tax=Caerostris extrusa TaxID=172846 RepID=A0AAV4YCV1_CAEEX|nr:hypothetical protein CEXT_645721 [Caerostris extrusa]